MPAPVLSDALAQIRVIDQMLGSNPADAMKRIEDLVHNTRLQPDEAAEAGYRMGYAARMLRDEEKAERSWRETAEKFPGLRGGRYSALALADTWFHRYAGERAQLSYWDDIQVLYSQVLGQDDAPFLPENVKAAVKANLNRINDSVLFGSAPTKLARYHKVESGEMLGSIGNKYRVDYESIARVNGINPNRIRQGMDLKLVVGDVSIVVRKNERDPQKAPTVTWFIDGRWAREYPACVGDGNKTPAGAYALNSKERDPSWTNPVNGQLLPNDHPENILGSRWMAMKGMNTTGLGIHGTTVDDSIPGYTSAGCIRLLNKDVEELFSFARIGARVTVLE
jgi:lipoprotein-anchoring transpeptidase ErfK/SrfK